MKPPGNAFTGLYIAGTILFLWVMALLLFLHYPVDFTDPLLYLFVLIQTHLYTGVFITMHDAIHGVVAPGNKKLNTAIGWICASIFAFNNYSILSRKHHLHHKHSVSKEDPDYANASFFIWYGKFFLEYATLLQFVFMAAAFDTLNLVFNEQNLFVFWVAPTILSSFQLFFFGTYLPHRGEHSPGNKHRARSQPVNHVIAFLSCYFFGYHYEHHAHPYLPWWKLPKAREVNDVPAKTAVKQTL